MAPLRIPVGDHPDGDPFAEQDRLREANSTLGRMEARAREEAAAEEARNSGQLAVSATKVPTSQTTRSSGRSTPAVNYGQAGRRSRSSAASAPPSDQQQTQQLARPAKPTSASRVSFSDAITIESSDDEAPQAGLATLVKAEVTPGAGVDPDALEDEEAPTPAAEGAADAEQADDDEGDPPEADEDMEDDEGEDDEGEGQEEGSDDQASNDGPQSEGDDDDEESGSGSEDLGSDDEDDRVGSQLKRKRETSPNHSASAKRRLVDSPAGASSAPTSDNEADTSLAFSHADASDSPAVPRTKPKRVPLSSLGRAISAPTSDAPTSAAASPAGSGADNDASGTKPKRKYKYKAALVPDKPKEVKTIRLEIKLAPPGTNPAEGVPQFSVVELAKEAGYGSGGEVKVQVEEENSEGGGSGSEDDEGEDGDDKKEDKGDGDEAMEGVEGGESTAVPVKVDNGTGPVVVAPKRRRAKNRIIGRYGGYDADDPFVDDSEIALYEPKYYHKPKRDGYFVCQGHVETLEEGTKRRGRVPGSKNKPKFDANGTSGTVGAVPPGIPHGTVPSVLQPAVPASLARMLGPTSPASSPGPSAPAFGAGNDALPPLRTAPEPAPRGPGRWPRKELPELDKKVQRDDFSDELKAAFAVLREAKDRETFVKGKFPPDLRPVLLEVAHKALELDEFDDAFFAELPKILPYNNFTLKKLVKREMFWTRIQRLEHEQNRHLGVVQRGVQDTLQAQQEEFGRKHQEWEAGERMRVRALQEWENGANVPGMAAVNAERPSEVPQPEPVFKYKLTDEMKASLLFILDIEDKMSDLKIEKQDFEKATVNGKEKPWSMQSARKAIYSKVCTFWPEGIMTSNQLSRENSVLKLRIKTRAERQAAGHQGDDSD